MPRLSRFSGRTGAWAAQEPAPPPQEEKKKLTDDEILQSLSNPLRDLFPEHFFQTARKAIAIFEQLDADWIFIGAGSVAAWGRDRTIKVSTSAINVILAAQAGICGSVPGLQTILGF